MIAINGCPQADGVGGQLLINDERFRINDYSHIVYFSEVFIKLKQVSDY